MAIAACCAGLDDSFVSSDSLADFFLFFLHPPPFDLYLLAAAPLQYALGHTLYLDLAHAKL
jgi:hypothetical protein